MRSVVSQENVDFEFIVIDGASVDDTLNVIDRFKNSIDKLLVEPDDGISDAFNKGVDLSRGDYVIFMNSGDVFVDSESLSRIAAYAVEGVFDCIIGRVAYIYKNKAVLTKGTRSIRRQFVRNYWPHQAMLISRRAFDRLGTYRSDFKLGMDYEWSLRLVFENKEKRILHVSEVISHVTPGGRSMSNFKQTFLAYHRARVLHFPHLSLISFLLSLLYIGRRTVGEWVRALLGR